MRVKVSNHYLYSKGAESVHTFGTNSHLVLSVVLEETLDSTAGELRVDASVVLRHHRVTRHKAQILMSNNKELSKLLLPGIPS